MIVITEISPLKLSGLTSLKVEFPYNEDLITAIKQFSPAIWHKNINAWEISISYLSKLLDCLTFYDDIKLHLLPDEIREISGSELSEDELNSFKYKPYEHQVEAINFGLHKNKWLNLSSMGLGKSLEAMYLAEALHRRGEIEHCLIICGVDSLRQNWKNEIKKFSNESVIVLGEKISKTGTIKYATLAERAKQLINPISEFFIIVNITNVRDKNFVEAFKKSKNKIDMIVFDEAHRASKSSQQGDNILKLDAKYKVAMTGTLLTASPISAYLPLSWTNNDKATLTNFKNQYCEFAKDNFTNYRIIGYKNLDLLKDELESCALRRTFQQVRGDMPKKTIEYELVEMSASHAAFYDNVKNCVKEEVDKVELNRNNLLSLLIRLRQATACPSILTTENIESSKLLRAVELAEDILDQGEKVVIMSNFIEPVNVLATKLQRFHPLLGTGEQSDDTINRNINDFRNSSDFNLFICTHSKCGTGYSFPECHYMIILDTPYTASDLNQSIDRIYRITSEQPIYVKILACAGTIDERVRQIVERKQDLSDFVVDNIENSLAEDLYDIITTL